MNEYERITAPGYIKLRGKEYGAQNDMIVETNCTALGVNFPFDPRVAIHLTDANAIRPPDPATAMEHLAAHSVCLTSEQAREFVKRILVEVEIVEWNERRKNPVSQPNQPVLESDDTGELSSAS